MQFNPLLLITYLCYLDLICLSLFFFLRLRNMLFYTKKKYHALYCRIIKKKISGIKKSIEYDDVHDLSRVDLVYLSLLCFLNQIVFFTDFVF